MGQILRVLMVSSSASPHPTCLVWLTQPFSIYIVPILHFDKELRPRDGEKLPPTVLQPLPNTGCSQYLSTAASLSSVAPNPSLTTQDVGMQIRRHGMLMGDMGIQVP